MQASDPSGYLPTIGPGSALLPRGITAPVSRYERFRTPGRFGDMWAPQLTAILWKLDQGYLEDWSDLVEFALTTDTDLASLYGTRISRVAQASFKVVPSKYGNPSQAALAAEFINDKFALIEDLEKGKRHLLHSIFTGQAFCEMEWDRDGATQTNIIRKLHCLHGHRFRYDEKWVPRLYDNGMRAGCSNMYGEALDPRRFIVHEHQEIAGYPNVGGVMRSAIWAWLFKRWLERWEMQGAEKFGQPFVYATVAVGTPLQVRDAIKSSLENLTSDHVAVIEQGGAITFESTTIATSSNSMIDTAINRYSAKLSKLIMGASDITDPGASGSQAAVTTRAGVTADPRMINDGTGLSETMQLSPIKWLLQLNVHKFGGVMPPIPTYEAKTASDEVKVDAQDLQEQAKPGTAVDTEAPAAMSVTEAAPDPKARRRSLRGRQTVEATTRTSSARQMTLPASSVFQTKLAQILRGE